MGVIHARLKHVDKAEKIFQKICRLQPERSTGYLSLAQLYLQENTKIAEAIELAEKATRLEPIAPSYFILSLAYDKNGELSKARTAIKKALELDPDNSRYRQMSKSLKEKK
jgi:tetratricopeptide (TPR) repeat protein